jgi:ribosome modulation factor
MNAYDAGAKAFRAGVSNAANPYSDSPDHDDWLSGWFDERDRLVG